MNVSYPLILAFRKVWRALFFWNTRVEIRPFALLPTICVSSFTLRSTTKRRIIKSEFYTRPDFTRRSLLNFYPHGICISLKPGRDNPFKFTDANFFVNSCKFFIFFKVIFILKTAQPQTNVVCLLFLLLLVAFLKIQLIPINSLNVHAEISRETTTA